MRHAMPTGPDSTHHRALAPARDPLHALALARVRQLAIAAVAIGLLIAGCGGSNNPATGGSVPTSGAAASTSTAAARTSTTSASTRTATAPAQSTTTSGAAGLKPPAGGPVPAGIKATSVTFVSPSTAFVLGTAPCHNPTCTAILRTNDRGRSWVGLPAPREAVSGLLGRGLWGLRFADARHGYAFGDGLWETDDGGASWRRTSGPEPIVIDLAAVQDRELVALTAPCLPGEGNCGGQLKLDLYRRPIASGSWQRVTGTKVSVSNATIAVHGADVWALMGSSVLVSTDGGASFAAHATPCTPGRPPHRTPVSVTVNGPHAYVLCIGEGFTGHTLKYLYRASGTGSTGWTLVGRPPAAGDGGLISAGSDGAIVIASYSAASWLYRSTDGGRTWSTVLAEDDGGAGWSDLGFTTTGDAVVVHGPAVSDGGSDGRPGGLLLSEDAGQSWSRSPFGAP